MPVSKQQEIGYKIAYFKKNRFCVLASKLSGLKLPLVFAKLCSRGTLFYLGVEAGDNSYKEPKGTVIYMSQCVLHL